MLQKIIGTIWCFRIRNWPLVINFLLLFTLSQNKVVAQDALTAAKRDIPIPAEFMAGTNRFTFQTQINRYFHHSAHFNFLSITSAAASYNNNLNDFDFINTSQISYTFYKGFGVASGIAMNSNSGFNLTAGLQYVYVNKTILFVIAPGVLLSKSYNIQGVSVIEYNPGLSTNWSIYSKIQGFYNYNTVNNFHQRSYMYARLGLIHKDFAFGTGINHDWYGRAKIHKENYGIFYAITFCKHIK